MNARDEWYDVRELDEDSYAIWECDSYAMYLAIGSERALLIDTGVGVGDLRGLVDQLTDRPVEVLITHTHWDHIGNAHQFPQVAAHPKECDATGTIAIDAVSDEFCHRPDQALAGWREEGRTFPDEFDPDGYRIEPVADSDPAYAGEVVDLGDRTLDLLAVPGHSPAQLGVLDRERRILYGADIIGKDNGLLALFEHTRLVEYLASVRRIYDLYTAGAFDMLVTGHMDPVTGADLELLDDVAKGLEAILLGEVTGEAVETSYGPGQEFTFDGFSVITR